jgi:ribosomal protein S12 methylthiotransferase accessory factor
MDITITFPGGKRVDAALPDGHVIHTDQSPANGGEGTAPEPFATFLASIGTCAGIYVLGFCQARGLPVEGIRLVQRNVFNPETHRLSDVGIDIELPAGFPDKYLAAVQRAAEHCKVKKAIAEPPAFDVRCVIAPPA